MQSNTTDSGALRHAGECVRAPVWFILMILLLALDSPMLSESKKVIAVHLFSADAISLFPDREQAFTVASPDGRKSILVDHIEGANYYDFRVRVSAHARRFGTKIGSHVSPEVLWAPDSKAFAETYSDAGAVGTFHLLIYVNEDGLKILEPAKRVRREFLSHPRECFFPEDPNIGAIRWFGDSSEILVAAETLPYSNCDGMGTFRAYHIGLPGGQIMSIYDQLDAKKQFWNQLGDELRGSDDECAGNTKSCEIPQLHVGSR